MTTEPDSSYALVALKAAAGIQRKPRTDAPEAPDATRAAGRSARVLIVEDDAPVLAPGQARKGAFIELLHRAVCATADAELAAAGRSTQGCPHLGFWLGYVSGRSAAEIGQIIAGYAPQTRGATTAAALIPPVVERVRLAMAVWVKTGKVTGVPQGLSGAGKAAGSGRAGPASAQVQFKLREGGAHGAGDMHGILGRLGHGRPLDQAVRSRMELAFAADFSKVRMHTDAEAASLSTELNARAFTLGHHIALGPDEYRPGTIVGDALLAHELAHVIQQEGGPRAPAPLRPGGDAATALETDADTAAAGAVAALWGGARAAAAGFARHLMPRLRTGLAVQRCSRTVKQCPRGKSWQVVGQPTGAGPTCLCVWRCLPAGSSRCGGGYSASESSGPSIQCYPEPCETPTIETVPDKYQKSVEGKKIEPDPGRKIGLGGHSTPLGGEAMCGCIPLDIEGAPEGTGQCAAPMMRTGAEITDLFPGTQARALGELDRKPSGGPPPEGPRVEIHGDPPAKGPEPPAKAPDPPAKAPDPPAKAPDPPAKAPDPPAKAPDPPAKAPDPPAKAPDPPAKAQEPPSTQAAGKAASARRVALQAQARQRLANLQTEETKTEGQIARLEKELSEATAKVNQLKQKALGLPRGSDARAQALKEFNEAKQALEELREQDELGGYKAERAKQAQTEEGILESLALKRPPLRQSLQNAVRKVGKTNADGKFLDANTGEVIEGEPVFGHKYGREHRRLVLEAVAKGMTQDQFNDWVNSHPEWFQLETKANNESHRFEKPGVD
jgi:molecular chaperone GrpE (heat shock protein)